ncbi:MAG: DUF2911 domain-containing protein [Salibacteraceae bacterium]
MKLMTRLFTVVLLFAATAAVAQIKTPQPSPGATISQTVGLTDITVVYSRPGMKDRTIFGDLVPYGKIWRTGANKATMIKFDEPVSFNNKEVPAGSYSIFTMPGKEMWTIMINKNTELWGAGEYKESEEVTRFEIKSTTLGDPVETFTIEFSHLTDNSAHLVMKWEKTRVAIPIKVDSETKVMAQIKEQLVDAPADAEVKASTYMAGGRYYAEHGKDQEMALKWMNKAIEMRPKAFWYIHYKAELLADMGNTKEAIKTAEESLKMAKASEEGDYGYIDRNEKLIARLKG